MIHFYLPFWSAREYQGRGMAKWMGFFLSEHSSSLWEEKIKMISPFPYQLKRKFYLFVNFIRMYSLQLLFLSSQIKEK